jgi:hypothetical protein
MSADTEPFHFAGFTTPNTTAVPDDFFDVLAPNLSEAELRVLIYIIRRTFGFKKESDTISLKQMVEGITTRDGRVLDRGTGMSKPGVSKGVKGLVAKGVIVVLRNSSPERGDEPTTYRLHFRGNNLPVPEETTFTRGGERRLHGGGNGVAPQETEEQETERQGEFEHSNDLPRMKNVDNLGITGYLDNLIVDLSREFGDAAHLASNCKQARNIFAELEITEEIFVEQHVYPARQRTKHQAKVRNKMAYFFATLREACGLVEAREA